MKIFLLMSLALIVGGIIFYSQKNDTDIISTPNDTSVNPTSVVTVVAFGDSLTAGLGVALDESYPSILEKQLNKNNTPEKSFRIINMGVSGETTTGGVDRVDFVIAQNPRAILLGLGANDMFRGTDPALIRTNLSIIIENIQKENIPLILLGMRSQASNGSVYQAEFDSIYSELAKKYDLPLVPFFLEGVALVPELNTADGIHPNRAGYEKIVNENILPIVENILRDVFTDAQV